MSALTDRITAVVDDHWPSGGGNFCEGCDWANWKPDAPRTWPAHLAERIAAELQLTEETRTLTDGWVQPTRNAAYYAMGMEPPPAVITHEHRWVSEWTAVGEQPAPHGFAPICEGCGGVKNRHFYGCSAEEKR